MFFFKRIFDFIGSFVLLLLISPIFIFLTIFLAFANAGKPFFVQKRPGKNEKIFSIIKFKTMNDRLGQDGNLLKDAERLTPIGSFVRKTSLDEIPQLINVFKGEMSFIGPRPLLTIYLPYYKEEEKLRHTIRPGITGLAQVSGRNLLGWNDRLAMDVKYVKEASILLDLKIVIKTIQNVLSSKDVLVDPQSAMLSLKEERTTHK